MLDDFRTFVLFACVVASFISVFLFFAGVLLSSDRVRDAIATIWVAVTSRLETQTVPHALLLSRAVMAALFENSSGFSLWKFSLLMLVVNSGAILGLILKVEVEISNIYRDERKGLLDKEDASQLLEQAAEAGAALLILAPLYLISWSVFDYVAYSVVNYALQLSSTRVTYRPIIIGTFIVLLISYILPFTLARFGYADGGLALLYFVASPLMPAMNSIFGISSCWSCSLLSLPAGLSVTLSSLLISAAIVLVRSPILFRFVAKASELVSATSGKKVRSAALNVGTAAGVLIVVLTWRSLFPSSTT